MNRQNGNRSPVGWRYWIVSLAVILMRFPIEAGEFGRMTVTALDGVPVDLAPIFQEAALRYEIDVRLLVAVARRESDFRRTEVSPVGARGVMQLMPATAEWLGVRDAFDPRQNIFGGARYLKMLDQMFDGDLDLILAAYNAGPGSVRKHHGVPPYRETRAYVASIRAGLGPVAAPVTRRQPHRPKVEADRQTKQKSPRCVDHIRPEVKGRVDEPRPNHGNRQTRHTDAYHGFAVFHSILLSHSIGQEVPAHHSRFDHHDGGSDSEEVPTPNMVDVIAVGEENDGHHPADHPAETCGPAAVAEKTFIDRPTEDGNVHSSLSRVKIWSVEQLKIWAKVSASSRLGT